MKIKTIHKYTLRSYNASDTVTVYVFGHPHKLLYIRHNNLHIIKPVLKEVKLHNGHIGKP